LAGLVKVYDSLYISLIAGTNRRLFSSVVALR